MYLLKVEEYIHKMKQKGKLIIIEGNDGSGKTTQLNLLVKYLKSKKIPTKTLAFPRYDDSFFGKFIAAYLRGEYGKLSDVNPYLITFPYALDRAEVRSTIQKWIDEGYYLVFGRYVPSNLAHQSGRLPKNQRKKYVDWDMEFEYKINKLPKEDKVIFLHVPYKTSLKLMENPDKQNKNYLKGKKKDMVEKNLEYVKNSEMSYLDLAKRFSHWITIECVKNGELRSIQEIHEDIKNALKI